MVSRSLTYWCVHLGLLVLVSLVLLGNHETEAICTFRLYYNLSAAVPSFVDTTCDIACCGYYPNIYCCNQCDSTFRNADANLNAGAITGIVFGVLIGLVIIFIIFVYVYGKWRRDKDPVGKAMYRLYRMSTRRRRRPKPTENGTTNPSQPLATTATSAAVPNGGTDNPAFSERQSNYPRTRRRAPGGPETPMHQEQLSQPPRPGNYGNTRKENPTSYDPSSNQNKYSTNQTQEAGKVFPSAPPNDLDARALPAQHQNPEKKPMDSASPPYTQYNARPNYGQQSKDQYKQDTKPRYNLPDDRRNVGPTQPPYPNVHNEGRYKEGLGRKRDDNPYLTSGNQNQQTRNDGRDRYNDKSRSSPGHQLPSPQSRNDGRDNYTDKHSPSPGYQLPTPSSRNDASDKYAEKQRPSPGYQLPASQPDRYLPSARHMSRPEQNTRMDSSYPDRHVQPNQDRQQRYNDREPTNRQRDRSYPQNTNYSGVLLTERTGVPKQSDI